MPVPASTLPDLLQRAIAARTRWYEGAHDRAFRLFNGFHEGEPALAVDIYGTTAVLHDYDDEPDRGAARAGEALGVIHAHLPWLRCAVLKTRSGTSLRARRGEILVGAEPDRHVREHGVTYAVELTMNRDASLYLDTRELRRWAIDHLGGKRVLNTFAYTGSLGIAALAGGARQVVQLDLNRRFLDLAQRSAALNGMEPRAQEFLTGDFFPKVAQLKRAGRRFDCVFLDPPFFATSARGTVDLEKNLARLVNKVRPLVDHHGWLVVVNNALYVSGRDFLGTLEALCADGYLAVETIIPVPEDFTGYPTTRAGVPVTDPAPFNHSTKIVVLRVKRKDGGDTPAPA